MPKKEITRSQSEIHCLRYFVQTHIFLEYYDVPKSITHFEQYILDKIVRFIIVRTDQHNTMMTNKQAWK